MYIKKNIFLCALAVEIFHRGDRAVGLCLLSKLVAWQCNRVPGRVLVKLLFKGEEDNGYSKPCLIFFMEKNEPFISNSHTEIANTCHNISHSLKYDTQRHCVESKLSYFCEIMLI